MVERIRKILAQEQRLHGLLTLRTADLPVALLHLPVGACQGQDNAVGAALILALAIDSLRGSDNDLANLEVTLANHLEQQGGTDDVRMEEGTVIGHVVLVGGLMKNHLDAFQSFLPCGLVADIGA